MKGPPRAALFCWTNPAHSVSVQRAGAMIGAFREFAMRHAMYRFAAPATLLFLGIAFTALARLAP